MDKKEGLFSYLPVSFFGSVMGLSGLSIGWRLASNIYGLPKIIGEIIGAIAIISFIALCVCYLLKIITSYDSFKAEYKSPLTRSFFGTFIISILLLPIILYSYMPRVAAFLWVLGVILMFLFALHIVSFWLGVTQEHTHVTPAWIIPVVGTLDIPLAFHLFDFSFGYDISLIALSIGLFFALPIFTLVLSRILFIEPMPEKLKPSLMILIAPFSVGFSAYVEVVGSVDLFAQMLYFIAIFMFISMIPQMLKSRFCCPFKVTWWAVSFPLSATLVATLKMANAIDKPFLHMLSIIFLFIVTLTLLWLSVRTLKDIFQGNLPNIA
ncbi:C4-dicarboxylate ABC transporter [Helicobacter sp. 16-1353]|uniref:SLAC1 anion channel family protein n=1 Tax=Helicobacter sp. 16-1353 TaxID=2004996 RepID=UPI000DCC3AC7|nr:SLAC1 anion channel family protein [Helicobacter sp. 16-1353]RAX54409.1 C4-dicarboxylate ABC transporter [Helicobacter sp. 16-1353]